MTESDRSKIERRYIRYYEAVEGIQLESRQFVRFLAWLENKASWRIIPTAVLEALSKEGEEAPTA